MRWSAHDVFVALAKVKEVKAYSRHLLGSDGIFAFPTIGPLYTIAQLLEDPISLNTNIGYYSYFANLLDLSALSVPLDFHENGMPFGITLMGRAFSDSAISGFAQSSLSIRNSKLGLNRN
jgi:allophanate hydrolase